MADFTIFARIVEVACQGRKPQQSYDLPGLLRSESGMEVDGISTDPIDPVIQYWLQGILILRLWIDGPTSQQPLHIDRAMQL